MCRHLKSSSEKIQTSPNPNNKPKKTDNGEFEQLLLPDKSLRIWCNWCYSEWIVLGLILKLNCLSCVWGGGEVVTGAVKPIGESSEKHRRKLHIEKAESSDKNLMLLEPREAVSTAYPKRTPHDYFRTDAWKGGSIFLSFRVPVHLPNGPVTAVQINQTVFCI